jgi:hypothetical protein
MAVYDFGTDGSIEMGRTVHAKMWFLSPELHLPHMVEGKEIELREGSQVVARGTVTWVSGLYGHGET